MTSRHAERTPPGSMRILVVEDNFISRSVQRELMAAYGACEAVETGEEAVALFRSALEQGAPYDLVCLDLVLAGIDGHEVLTRLRALEEHHGRLGLERARLFVVTVQHDREHVLRAFRAGCDAYLHKPLTPLQVQQALRAPVDA